MAGVLLLGGAFLLGEYDGAKRATFVANAVDLVWMTGVDQWLQKQDVAGAQRGIDAAVNGHVAVLTLLERSPAANFISFNSPWMAERAEEMSHTILKKTEGYYADKGARILPETREYLARYANDGSDAAR